MDGIEPRAVPHVRDAADGQIASREQSCHTYSTALGGIGPGGAGASELSDVKAFTNKTDTGTTACKQYAAAAGFVGHRRCFLVGVMLKQGAMH